MRRGDGGSRPPRRLRVGFAGTGYIAEWHAKALASVAGATLVSVCDRVAPRAEAFAGRFGARSFHPSLEAMLSSESLDVVHVLLPPDVHFEAARTTLAAGVNLLLEKPMAVRAEDCDALVRAAASRGVTVGVSHNFLFAEPYERLRGDVRAGRLGRLDHVEIVWNRELPQATQGPFDLWMLREPGNMMLEIGSHSVAHLLDLMGLPDRLDAHGENPLTLPTGSAFYRRWRVDGARGATGIDLRFSFVAGFAEHRLQVRGTLASAEVDLLRNTYVLRRHRPLSDDLDRYAMTVGEARDLVRQARQTLRDYVLGTLRVARRGGPYEASIARTLAAFYGALGGALDERVSAARAAEVIRLCERLGAPANRSHPVDAPAAARLHAHVDPPRVLVLGGTGFIGRELVRQLRAAGHPLRLLVRSAAKLPPELRSGPIDVIEGDVADDEPLRRAMTGIECVYHLARANVRTWPDYQRHEIDVTRRAAEAALAAGVRRFIYTGTIDSFYAGSGAGTISDRTPLDPRIGSRNLYARAKAESERLLQRMHRERGLPLVILRPGIVIGRGGSPFHWGVAMWHHGFVCETWGAGRNALPIVLVEDVAAALVAALDRPGLEGDSFNLVAAPCLSAQEYLDALDRAGHMRLERHATPIIRFYLRDLSKWVVKRLLGRADARRPAYRDWESRTQRARFDCAHARERLGWTPIDDRDELIRLGIAEPLREALR